MIFLLVAAAFQPDPEIQIHGDYVWGGTYVTGRVAAVQLLVRNQGPALTGALQLFWAGGPALQPPDPSPHSLVGARGERFLVPVQLPEQSVRRFSLSVPSGDSDAQDALWVFLLNPDGRVLARCPIPGTPYSKGSGRVAVVGSGLPSAARTAFGYPASVTVRADSLPDHWAGYDAIDVLLCTNFDGTAIRPSQKEALLHWVGQGGTLVWMGTRKAELAGEIWKELFASDGISETETDELRFPEGTVRLGRRIPVLQGGHKGALSSLPLVALFPYGAGRVALFGFHADLAEAEPLWRLLAPPERTGGGDAQARLVDRVAQEFPGFHPPRIDLLLVALILYALLVGPVEYFVLRRKGRMEWTWVTFPSVAGLMSGSAMLYAILNSPAAVAEKRMAVIDELPNRFRREHWIQSILFPRGGVLQAAPRRGATRFFARQTAAAWAGGLRDIGSTWTMRPDSEWQVDGWRVGTGMTAIVEATRIERREPRIRFLRSKLTPRECTLEVENELGALENAAVISKFGVLQLGTLSPGRNRFEFELTYSGWKPFVPYREEIYQRWGEREGEKVLQHAKDLLRLMSHPGGNRGEEGTEAAQRKLGWEDWLAGGGFVLYGFAAFPVEPAVGFLPGGKTTVAVTLVRCFGTSN